MMRILIFLCFLSFVNISFAQKKKEHKKRTFIDKRNRFYINKSLPIYLRIATSPEEGAPSHLLESEDSKDYVNPLYLDTEGYNTIRTPSKVDKITKKIIMPVEDIIFEVYADGMAPQTSSKFIIDNDKKYKKGGIFYYGKNIKIKLKSEDGTSGLENIHFSNNNVPYEIYKDIINMNIEKTHIFKYYSSDNVGNSEKVHTKEFTVDLNPPKTVMAIDGPVMNDIISPKASITLSANDNLSGVKIIKYYFDDGKHHIYTGKPISLSRLKDGEHTFKFYAVDNVNNDERDSDNWKNENKDNGKYSFYLDSTVPEVNYLIVGDQHIDKYLYVSPRSKTKLFSEDNKSGSLIIQYGIGIQPNSEYSVPFHFINKIGLQTINYVALDKVTNKTKNKKLVVFLDNLSPVTGITYGRPQFFNRDTLFINKTTFVKLFAVDYESGVKRVEYSIDGGNYKEYSKFVLPEDGFHKISFRTIDNVNNEEEFKTSEVVVDNTAPVIYLNMSILPIGEKDGLAVYPPYTRMYIAATDKYCGTEKILYSINGGKMKDYSSSDNISKNKFLTKERKYSVRVIAKDKLGNQNEKTIQFYIDRKGGKL